MTIEHYLVTLYIIVGILISFHYRMVEKEDSTFWVVFTGIIRSEERRVGKECT